MGEPDTTAPPPDERDVLDAARAALRGHASGELKFDEHVRTMKYVIDARGRIAAPVMVAMLQAAETVLCVPEDIEGAMELLVTLVPFDEDGPDGHLTDRWRIYHGEPEDVRWAFLDIDAMRFGPSILDGDAIDLANPLGPDEAKLCRFMNTDHADDLRRLCEHFDGREIVKPLVVGVDPLGIDVRRKFDVMRLETIEPMPTADDARRVLARMIEIARTGEGATHHG